MNEYTSDTERLNEEVKVKLAPSTIHGVGVMALRDLKRGEKLYADNLPVIYKTRYKWFGFLESEVRQYLLEKWPEIINGSNFMYPEIRIKAYLNHSEEPNYDPKSDRTLTDIKEGEEITMNYRQIEGYTQVYPFLS